MKPSIVLAIALLSGSLPLAAQQAPNGMATGQASFGVIGTMGSNVTHITVIVPQQIANCPAMLTARHLSDGTMIRTGNKTGTQTGPTHPKGIGQWLHIAMNAPQGAVATLAVHGFSNKARATETNLSSAPDAVRTVTVYLAPASNGQAGGDLWAPGLTAVASLDLVSLNYDDGKDWSAPGGRTCRVTPDPLMMVSAR
jgi:hypothetical protein